MYGFYGPPPTKQELEAEQEFDHAFSLLRKSPELTAINLDASLLPNGPTRWRLEELGEHYGYQLQFLYRGRVTIRRAERLDQDHGDSSPSSLGFAAREVNAVWHWLGHESSIAKRKVASWDAGFQGLHKGFR